MAFKNPKYGELEISISPSIPIVEVLSDNKIYENNLFDEITVLKPLITNEKI